MRVYVSGPMTGVPDWNRGAFRERARLLLAAGHEPVLPLDSGVPLDAPKADHMRADIALLLTCDAITLLPGWAWSHGATLEARIAHVIGLEVLPME